MSRFINFLVRYKVLIIILVILIITGVLLFLFYPPVKYFGSKKFVSNEYNISFYLPKNWQEIDNKVLVDRYNKTAKLGFSKTDSKNASFIIKVDDFSGKKNFNVSGSMEELKKIFPKELEDFKLLYMDESSFQDMPCIKTEYTYSLRTDIVGGKQETQQEQIIFLKNEKLYWLIFASYPEDFSKDEKDFNKILESMRFE